VDLRGPSSSPCKTLRKDEQARTCPGDALSRGRRSNAAFVTVSGWMGIICGHGATLEWIVPGFAGRTTNNQDRYDRQRRRPCRSGFVFGPKSGLPVGLLMNFHATRPKDGLKRFSHRRTASSAALSGPPASSALKVEEERTNALAPRTQGPALNRRQLRIQPNRPGIVHSEPNRLRFIHHFVGLLSAPPTVLAQHGSVHETR
jgi:hypothetical protein